MDRVISAWTEALTQFVGDDVGRSVLVSGGGRRAGIAEDVARPAASVAKLWIAVALHDAAADGEIDTGTLVAVRDLPPTDNPTVLSALDEDHRLSLGELAGFMLAVSDNRAAHHLAGLLGQDRVDRAATELGCTRTALRSGFDDGCIERGEVRSSPTSASDCAITLDAVMTSPRLAPLRPPLRSSLFNSRILSRLPDDVIVSHKTGSLDGVANDVGVLHTRRGPLTMCFLTEGQPDTVRTSSDIGTCARALYDAFVEGSP